MISRILFTVLLFATPVFGFCFDIKVGIFNEYSLKRLVVTIVRGNYDLIMDSTYLYEMEENHILYLTLVNGYITISSPSESLGSCTFLDIQSKEPDGVFSIKPVDPGLITRTYDEDCQFRIDINRIMVINVLGLEKYIAGVVEAEGGPQAEPEFYKTQAILCRTYALKNLGKFTYAGFHLCDDVSCQAYKGKCENKSILKATEMTKGLVIIGSDSSLITAAFHSNSGGNTMNSGDIWLVPLPYLISVEDPFSLNQLHSSWQKTIAIEEWRGYLEKQDVQGAKSIPVSDFKFYQDKREKYYIINSFQLELKTIRSDWELKSTYFSIIPSKDKLIFKGKGYGHGVGLSQEGAMNMASQGYDYQRIIHFYYKDVTIVDYTDKINSMTFSQSVQDGSVSYE